MGITEQARRDLDQRIYNVMGKKLYQARSNLKALGPDAAVEPLLDALDDCYALLATLFDSQGASNIYPEVPRVEDGHAYEESFWPTLKERHECAICGSLEHLHIQASGDTEFSDSELDTIREGYWHP